MERDESSDHVKQLRRISASNYRMPPGEILAAETVKLYLMSLDRQLVEKTLNEVVSPLEHGHSEDSTLPAESAKENSIHGGIRASVDAISMRSLIEKSAEYVKSVLIEEMKNCEDETSAAQVRKITLDAVMAIDPEGVVYGMTGQFLDFFNDCSDAVCDR